MCDMNMILWSYLQYLITLCHALPLGWTVGLDTTNKDANIISSHQPQPNAALLHKADVVLVRAVPDTGEKNIIKKKDTLFIKYK